MRKRDDAPFSIDVRIGQRINLRRGILGLSQQQLAELLKVPLSEVKAVESGFSRPTASQILKLCQALNVVPTWLFSENPPKKAH